MSSLTLVRHGQATPFQRCTDGLTALGETQARKLAGFWLKNRVEFDEVVTGKLTRQVQTERLISECYREAGEPWPEAERDGAWNEYDARGILARVGEDGELAALASRYEEARGASEEYRHFQLMFEAAMRKWLDRSGSIDDVEPWPAFRDRVSAAVRRIMAGGSSRRVAVFTSGGPIGFCVNLAMGGPDKNFLEVNWRVRNCSLTEFLFRQGRITLDAFNHVGHLEDAALRSYR